MEEVEVTGCEPQGIGDAGGEIDGFLLLEQGDGEAAPGPGERATAQGRLRGEEQGPALGTLGVAEEDEALRVETRGRPLAGEQGRLRGERADQAHGAHQVDGGLQHVVPGGDRVAPVVDIVRRVGLGAAGVAGAVQPELERDCGQPSARQGRGQAVAA